MSLVQGISLRVGHSCQRNCQPVKWLSLQQVTTATPGHGVGVAGYVAWKVGCHGQDSHSN